MNITIYTIQNCSFCQQLKDYLTSKNLTYTEKDVEKNKNDLTEMISVSDNFAGVPFTLIVKDDGSQVKLKGFTQEEFDEVLAVQQQAPVTGPTYTPPPAAPDPAPVNTQPPQMYPPMNEPMAPTPAPVEPIASPTVDTPAPVTMPSFDINQNVPSNPVAPAINQPPASTMPPANFDVSQPQVTNQPPVNPPSGLPNVPDFNANN